MDSPQDTLSANATVSRIERLAAESRRGQAVEIDARSLRSIGLYPASLLCVWLRSTRRRNRRLLLPGRDALSLEAQRVLLGRSVLFRLQESGVALDYAVGPTDEDGIGITAVTSATDRTTLLNSVVDRITSKLPGPAAEAIASDISHTILFELLDNAVIHANAEDVYFAVHLTPASQMADAADDDLPSHPNASTYIDVVVGDSGPGLNARLAALMRDDYEPPFQTRHDFTPQERVLSYAFEFESTSDESARRRRLAKLLESDVDPRAVATGLSCVLNVIRQRHGTLVVRTSSASLTVDYSRGWEGAAAIRGQREMGVKHLRQLPGTHFGIRIPLERLTVRRSSTRVFPEASVITGMRIINPWTGSPNRTESEILHDALIAVSDEVERHRLSHGVTLIRRGARPISSRAKALFGASIASLHRGDRHIACFDDYFADFDKPHPDLGHHYLPAHESGSVFFGDLFTNEFQSVAWCGAPVPDYLAIHNGLHYQLTPKVIQSARSLYARSLLPELQGALRQPHVRLEGHFDIDHRYVTTVFYTVSRAVDDPRLRQKFAEWALDAIPPDCEILVVAAGPVLPLAQRINELLKLTRGSQASILEVYSEDSSLGNVLRLAGREAVVLTDVMCTTETIRRHLASLPSLSVKKILTVVDARSVDQLGEDITVTNPVRRLPVSSVAAEPLHAGQPAAQHPGQLFLLPDLKRSKPISIDPSTHRPTVYVRPIKTRLTTAEVLHAATQSGALRYGHSEYVNRHYSVFLHLPRLFAALQKDLEVWIVTNIGSVPAASSAGWRVLIVAVDGSLSWAIDYCARILPHARIEEVTWNHLRAPDPPQRDERIRNVLILAPASASGELARRAIEYASRAEPDRIYVLIAIARMEPSHLSFLTTLEKFRYSSVKVDFLAVFTIRGYLPGKASCPLCGDVARLERLRGPGAGSTAIDRVLDEKIGYMAAWPVDHHSPNFYFAASEIDISRARVRALYEAAEFDHAAQDELRTWLSTDPDARERFYEALSLERLSDHFNISVLRRRLGTSFDDLRAHAADLLWNIVPPVAVSPLLQGLIHIDEESFLRAAPRLLEAYSGSQRDFEDLCIALFDLLYWPSMRASFFGMLEQQKPTVVELVESTRTAISSRRTRRSIGDLLARLNFVKATLGRSSHFFDRIDRLSKLTGAEMHHDVTRLCGDVHDAWALEIVPHIVFIAKHSHWEPLVRRHEQLATSIQQLSASVAHMRSLQKSAAAADMRLTAGKLRAVASEAVGASAAFVAALSALEVNPLNSALANIPDNFATQDGSVVRVERQLDYGVPTVFCSMSALNDVIQELTVNWFKFKDRPDARLRLRAFRKEGNVVLAFEDNYRGAVKPGSAGGLRMAKNFCRDYGGELKLIEEVDGFKSIQLHLRSPEYTGDARED